MMSAWVVRLGRPCTRPASWAVVGSGVGPSAYGLATGIWGITVCVHVLTKNRAGKNKRLPRPPFLPLSSGKWSEKGSWVRHRKKKRSKSAHRNGEKLGRQRPEKIKDTKLSTQFLPRKNQGKNARLERSNILGVKFVRLATHFPYAFKTKKTAARRLGHLGPLAAWVAGRGAGRAEAERSHQAPPGSAGERPGKRQKKHR